MLMARPNYFVSAYLHVLQDFNADMVTLKKNNKKHKEERYKAALAEAAEIAGNAEKSVANWAVLKPDHRTADANLLNGEYGVLSKDELQALADKNRENYTMLRLLSVYAVTHYGDNHGIHFVTVEGKRKVYAAIYQKAVDMIEQIYSAPVADSVLDAWMVDPADKPLYAEISTRVIPF